MQHMMVLIFVVLAGLAMVTYGHGGYGHGHGHGHGGNACQEPSGHVHCSVDSQCSTSLCPSAQCSSYCDSTGHCNCRQKHTNKRCTGDSDCLPGSCHPDEESYCHDEECHCHERKECHFYWQCECPTGQRRSCDEDRDRPGHKHCHCHRRRGYQ